jgi:adenylate cyclase
VVVRSIQTNDAHTEYTPIGHSISLAARLQTLAAPGSVVIGESVRKFVDGYFQLKALGASRIKGVSEPVEVFRGVGPRSISRRRTCLMLPCRVEMRMKVRSEQRCDDPVSES